VTLSEVLGDLHAATSGDRGPVAAEEGDATIDKGMRVRIVRGDARGTHGVVFWLGDGRCGLRGDDGETHWARLAHVVVEGAPDPAPPAPAKASKSSPAPAKSAPADDDELAFGKGDSVRWVKGRQTGTGTVFWIGKNKFGDGMRVGLKDAETGETVWANARDCALEP
jgi:hypothetical protein